LKHFGLAEVIIFSLDTRKGDGVQFLKEDAVSASQSGQGNLLYEFA
jgi:hypothetical protein